MCRCRGCDIEIEVKWHLPQGAPSPLLENLCTICLHWAEIAKAPGPLPEVRVGKRKPRMPAIGEEEENAEG